jgi:hypothetical protein
VRRLRLGPQFLRTPYPASGTPKLRPILGFLIRDRIADRHTRRTSHGPLTRISSPRIGFFESDCFDWTASENPPEIGSALSSGAAMRTNCKEPNPFSFHLSSIHHSQPTSSTVAHVLILIMVSRNAAYKKKLQNTNNDFGTSTGSSSPSLVGTAHSRRWESSVSGITSHYPTMHKTIRFERSAYTPRRSFLSTGGLSNTPGIHG